MKKLPIYELKIDEKLSDDSEVSVVSFVDEPAIMRDFLAFRDEFVEPKKGEHETDFIPRCISYMVGEGKDQDQATAICYSIWEQHFAEFQESYNDYPEAAKENAKIALRWAEENGWGDCGTTVGKVRANQLANGESITRDTIARMAAFERHRQNSKKELGDGCGRLMWLAWGGDEGIAWAQRKLEQIDKMTSNTNLSTTSKHNFQIVNEEQRIVSGPLMVADQLIYRNNEKMGEHYVKFTAETIKSIAIKFSKKKYQMNVNLMHDPKMKVEGVTMFESFIVDKKRGIQAMEQFKDIPDGSWFGSFYVENEDVWQAVKKGELRGFSVEGLFQYDEPLTKEEQALKEISKLLNELID